MNVVRAMTLLPILAALAFGGSAALAQGPGERLTPPSKIGAQKKAKRAPTRIRVQPVLRYRLDSVPYPRTDNLGYPGPNAVRQCVSWLQPEHRPSGPVVTPQMRCWWERG